MNHSILWRAIEFGGHEACRLYQLYNEWRLEGTAVFQAMIARAGSLTSSYVIQVGIRYAEVFPVGSVIKR